MADNKEVLGLDLDVTDFKEGIAQATEGLTKLVEGSNIEGLSSLIIGLGEGLGIVAVAALALKTTFDLVFEGDQIKRVDSLFENLADTFNLSGAALKDNLLKAAGGMADTTAVLDAGNKAMIGLGQNSAMIPQIMEVARKATLAFGGDLTERFQGIATAITSGNARMLKANGIFIDSKKAMQDYAGTIGATTGELTEFGRQQATFNAVMAYAATNLKSVDTEIENSTTAWVRLKTEIKEAGDSIALAINKAFGPTIASAIKSLASVIHDAGTSLKANFGDGAEKSAAKLEILKNRAESFTKAIEQLEQKKGLFSWLGDALFIHKGADALVKLKKGLEDTDKQIEEYHRNEVHSAMAAQSAITANEKSSNQARSIDRNKQLADQIKLQEETMKIQQKATADAIKNAKSEGDLKVAQLNRIMQAHQKASLDKRKIDQQLASHEIADVNTAKMKKLAISKDLHQQELKFMKDERAEHKAMLQNELDDSTSFWNGFSNAAKVSSSQASQDMHNFGLQGKTTFDTLQKSSESAFEEIGKSIVDHSKSAADIMKDMFFSAIGDIAIQKGEVLLAESVYPPNPLGLAAGAGLIALGGAIKAMGGGSGSSSSGTISSGAGGGGGGVTSAAQAAADQPAAAGPPTGNLTVNIQGDYLNTAETQRTLLQAVRDATDQTGFQYLQVGQTGAQSY